MLNIQLKNLGRYASKGTKLHRLILIAAFVQVPCDKVALMG